MTAEERSRLELLDAALRSGSVRDHIRSVVVRVSEALAQKKRCAHELGADSVRHFCNDAPG